jgi:hypothetical protein
MKTFFILLTALTLIFISCSNPTQTQNNPIKINHESFDGYWSLSDEFGYVGHLNIITDDSTLYWIGDSLHFSYEYNNINSLSHQINYKGTFKTDGSFTSRTNVLYYLGNKFIKAVPCMSILMYNNNLEIEYTTSVGNTPVNVSLTATR